MSQYTDIIRRWAVDSRRAGCLPEADGTGEVGLDASEAGRRLAVRFTIKIEGDRVTDARYQVFGCGFSMAACAVAADKVVGRTLDEIRQIDAAWLDSLLEELPPERLYCADLAVAGLRAAIASARQGGAIIVTRPNGEAEPRPRTTREHVIYRSLMQSPHPDHLAEEDRHLFACLLSVAGEEPWDMAAALGLEESALESIFLLFFPGVDRQALFPRALLPGDDPPQGNAGILAILLSHVPMDRGFNQLFVACWLARILATRAALPGHLWIAMGLTERPQLTAAIERHLPSLAKANNRNMRWKRYLYKELCDRNGGTMCRAPNCEMCSDYSLCFVA